jgi:thiosulfate dehydrogenase
MVKVGKDNWLASGLEWTYPPLYGEQSYNTGAGLYRISSFASFVKYNMPYGTTFQFPILTDEEAWDVAAFVNSMPRPEKDFSGDWPDVSKKPIDHPMVPMRMAFRKNNTSMALLNHLLRQINKWKL